MRTIKHGATCALLGVAFLVTAGCGGDADKPPLGKVVGKVTYNGQPLKAGSVMFTPEGGSGQPASGHIEADGSYTLTTFNTGDGAILGGHKVTVEARDPDAVKKTAMPKDGGPIVYKMPKPLIPTKYTTTGESPLKYTVEAGANTINIDLKD